jgi:hypothetical protein
MSFEEIRDVRRIYDIHDILGVSSRARWMVCPLPGHVHRSNTPSFSIYWDGDGVQRFMCHGNCGLFGDVLDLVGYLEVPGYDKNSITSVMQAVAHLGEGHEIKPPERPRRVSLAPDQYKQYLPPGKDVFAYAATRGIQPETLESFRVGQKGHYMAMPCFEDGQLTGIKFRTITDGLRFYAEKGSKKGLFNYDAVAYTDEPVLIVKGEIPVMVLSQLNILSCAPTGGEASAAADYYPILSFSKQRIVIGDNDPDPEVRKRMQAFAEERASTLRATLRFTPSGYKDIDQWILSDETAVEQIRGWMVSGEI